MKKIAFALFLLGLSLPTAQAKKPTRWDYLTSSTPIFGSVTVIAKNGKKYKDNSVAFSPSSLTLYSRGDSIPREEVKEVVVREPRDRCCARIKLPIAPIELAILAGDGTVGTVIFLIILSPLEAGFIAATPPAVLVEGIRHLKPRRVLYKVVP